MKKIIGLLTILLFTTTVFGVINIGDRSHIEYGVWSEKTNMVHFTTEWNGHKYFYMLAYEPNFSVGTYDGMERNVYLYAYLIDVPYRESWSESQNKREKELSLEGARWIRVSDAVLNNYYIDWFNYQDVDFFTYDKDYQNSSNSSVVVEGNTVTFTLGIHKKENGSVTVKDEIIVLEAIQNRASSGYYYRVKND